MPFAVPFNCINYNITWGAISGYRNFKWLTIYNVKNRTDVDISNYISSFYVLHKGVFRRHTKLLNGFFGHLCAHIGLNGPE